MRIWSKLLSGFYICVALVAVGSFGALADYNARQCSTSCTAFQSFVNTMVHTAAMVLVNSSGTEIGTSMSPLFASVTNVNSNGQATMANSSPVVIASNQS